MENNNFQKLCQKIGGIFCGASKITSRDLAQKMADPFTRKIVHNVRQSIGRAPVEMIFKVHSNLET